MKEEEQKFRVARVPHLEDDAYYEQIALTPEQAVSSFVKKNGGVNNDEWCLFSTIDENGSLRVVDAERDDDEIDAVLLTSSHSPLESYLVSTWGENGNDEIFMRGTSVEEVARFCQDRFTTFPRPIELRVIPETGEHTLHFRVRVGELGSTAILEVLTETEADAAVLGKGRAE